MTLALSDGLFATQTEENIRNVVNTKWESLRTLDAIVPIKTLDFLISFSSVSALVGNLGQSNYAMANTVVDGCLARHQNAFSVCVPSISDLGYFARYRGARESNIKSTMLSPDGESFTIAWDSELKKVIRTLCIPRGRLAQTLLRRSRTLLHS